MASSSDKRITAKKVMTYIAFLALACILMYFSFKNIDWNDFLEGMKSCSLTLVILSTIVSLIISYIRAIRWKILIYPLDRRIATRECFDGVNTGYLVNFIFPRAGEVTRCGVITGAGKASFESVLGSVVIERAIDMISMILIFIAVFIFEWKRFGDFLKINVLDNLAVKFGNVGFWITLVAIAAAIVLAILLIRRYKAQIMKNRVFGKILNILTGLKDGLLSWRKMDLKLRLKFIWHTIVIWFGYWLMSYLTIIAFPAMASFDATDALFIMLAGSLGWVVPVQGGIGAYHFIVALALTTIYGMTQTDGMVYATISHTSQSIMMILAGLASMVSIAFYKKAKQ